MQRVVLLVMNAGEIARNSISSCFSHSLLVARRYLRGSFILSMNVKSKSFSFSFVLFCFWFFVVLFFCANGVQAQVRLLAIKVIPQKEILSTSLTYMSFYNLNDLKAPTLRPCDCHMVASLNETNLVRYAVLYLTDYTASETGQYR